MIDRRALLVAGGSLAGLAAFAPRLSFARAATNRRFVFIIQRGAADGLSTVAPVGDPGFVKARGELAEDFADAPKLDSMFALHPRLTAIGGLHKRGQALFAHAIASPYRDRSHFDGQNVLETGGAGAYQTKDGWLNRLLGVVPTEEARAIAVAAAVPMALRGKHDVASYAPSNLPETSGDLLARVDMLYRGDAQLHSLWSEAMATRALTSDITAKHGRDAAATGALAAKLLQPADGARIAMIETGGWDTHAAQRNRIGGQLKALDAMIAALQKGLGPLWNDTMVLVATEFGRTVAINGTRGTDHGTASVAMLLGGAVKGGRVMADWPGLAQAQLYDGRDLKPTTGLDAFIGGAVSSHFGVAPDRTMAALFPGAKRTAAIEGLVRT
ncbi:MAG TPA: DUF1501 domain-containing protein [Sphingomonas sp.]|nr:DUF1501 domain-containing protein [Sphingomonas sp.]